MRKKKPDYLELAERIELAISSIEKVERSIHKHSRDKTYQKLYIETVMSSIKANLTGGWQGKKIIIKL